VNESFQTQRSDLKFAVDTLRSDLEFYKKNLTNLRYANKAMKTKILSELEGRKLNEDSFEDPDDDSNKNTAFNLERNPDLFIYKKEQHISPSKTIEEKQDRVLKLRQVIANAVSSVARVTGQLKEQGIID
jgi:hypothetical protein